MNGSFLRLAFAIASVAAAASPAAEPAADFDAAWHRATSHDTRVGGLVFRHSIEPRWIDDGAVLVYRVRTGAYAHEVVRVDCRSGEKRILEPNDPLAVELRSAKARRLRLDRPLRGGNGPETSIRLENATTEVLETVWIEGSGERRSYGELAAGASRDQHTFAGHVWGFERGDGTLLAAAAAEQGGSTFRIDSLEPDVVPSGSRGAGERRRPRAAEPTAGTPRAEVILRDGDLVAKRGDGSEQPLTSGATKDFHFTDDRFVSPDGRWMIALKVHEGEHRTVTIVESTPKDQPQPRVIEFRYDKPGDRIDERFPHLFDLDTLAEVPLDESLFATPLGDLRLPLAP